MKVFFDTSVLVAAVLERHPMHLRALSWLRRGRAEEFDWVVASHSLAEMYAVLTALPLRPRLSTGSAWRLIHENIEGSAEIVVLSAAETSSTLKRLAEGGLSGGVVYDALLARVAEKSGVQRLLTFDPDDFKRVWPEGADLITVP